jgi:uncharacterized protein (TIGR03083 family)
VGSTAARLTVVDIPELIDSLQREGDLLAAAAASSGPDAAISPCPGWTMRDLVLHVGGVHRWATAFVAGAHADAAAVDFDAAVGPSPAEAQLVDWFREGHAGLVSTLRAADPKVQCWTFLPAPSPLAFWARRQAHETGIHRVDAESASGPVTTFAPGVAVDGLNELLLRFASRPKARPVEEPRILHVHASDADENWFITVGPEQIDVSSDGADADCTIDATASELFVLLWNRRGPDGLDVSGDTGILELWRDSVRIRWS